MGGRESEQASRHLPPWVELGFVLLKVSFVGRVLFRAYSWLHVKVLTGHECGGLLPIPFYSWPVSCTLLTSINFWDIATWLLWCPQIHCGWWWTLCTHGTGFLPTFFLLSHCLWSSLCCCCFFLFFPKGLFKWCRESEWASEDHLPPAVLLPNCQQQLEVFQAETRSPRLSPGLYMDGRDSQTWTIICCLLGMLPENGIGNR